MKNLLSDLLNLKSQKEALEEKEKKILYAREEKYKKSSDEVRILLRELDLSGGRIRSISKEAINHLVNNNLDKTGSLLLSAKNELLLFDKKLRTIGRIIASLDHLKSVSMPDFQDIHSRMEGFRKDFSEAKEELFEAKILDEYLRRGVMLKPGQLPLVDFSSYSGAVSDVCGELVRKARILRSESPDYKKHIEVYYRDMKSIYQVISNFGFSNKSGVRNKVEQLKGFVYKMEEFLYDK